MSKAQEFRTAAEIVHDLTEEDPVELGNAYVTLAVRAEIAAADVICCARLGRYARPDNHDEAVSLLRSADKALATDLGALLGMKTKAGYTAQRINRQYLTRAQRAVQRLVTAAERVS